MRILRSDIVVEASPHRVWELLTDVTSYPEWNPLVPHMEGTLQRGEEVTLQLSPTGQPQRDLEVKVAKAVPGEELVLRTRVGWIPVLVAEHRLFLEPTEDGGTHVMQRQDLKGPLVPFIKDTILAVLDGIVAMNKALKARLDPATSA